jgi:hypothetical protein
MPRSAQASGRRRGDGAREARCGESVKQVAEPFGTSIWCIYDLGLGRTHAHCRGG